MWPDRRGELNSSPLRGVEGLLRAGFPQVHFVVDPVRNELDIMLAHPGHQLAVADAI